MAARIVAGAFSLLAAAVVIADARLDAQVAERAWTANIDDVRSAAALMPGRRPLRINVRKFAESRRTKNFSIKGAPPEPSVQARTAFQIVYADGTIMVDAGMDLQIHKFFGRGVEEPYDADAARQIEAALTRARLIVVTHEHGDHVAGVIRGPAATELARKTILTRTQVQSLMSAPQMPDIKLTEEMARRFLIVDYERYLPIAPGLALIKAGGHTPGSQMVYLRLESGREYLLIGDVAWHMDGVRSIVGKDAPWVTEDQPAVIDQLRWLNDVSRTQPEVVIVASHDDEEHKNLVQKGILGDRLE